MSCGSGCVICVGCHCAVGSDSELPQNRLEHRQLLSNIHPLELLLRIIAIKTKFLNLQNYTKVLFESAISIHNDSNMNIWQLHSNVLQVTTPNDTISILLLFSFQRWSNHGLVCYSYCQTISSIVIPVYWLVIFSFFHVKSRLFVTKVQATLPNSTSTLSLSSLSVSDVHMTQVISSGFWIPTR